MILETGPVGYYVRTDVRCCAACVFGGYLGGVDDGRRLCICELLGEPDDGDYSEIAKEPLGLCDAFKWPHEIIRRKEDGT